MSHIKSIWWLIALRGLLSIIIGMVALFWPGVTFVVFIVIVAIYILVEGIVNTISGLASIGKKHWLLMLVEGLFGLFIAWVLLTQPGFITLTTGLFIQVLGIWFLVTGILRMVLAFVVKDKFLMFLSGLLGLIVGIILFAQPLTGLLALIWFVGFFAILTGILLVAFAFQVKDSKK